MGRRKGKNRAQHRVPVDLESLGFVQGKRREEAIKQQARAHQNAEQQRVDNLVEALSSSESPTFGCSNHRAPTEKSRRLRAAQIALQNIKQCFGSNLEHAQTLVEKALDTEHTYHVSETYFDLSRIYEQCMRRKTVGEKRADLAAENLVVEKPVYFYGSSDGVAFPREAQRDVETYCDTFIDSILSKAVKETTTALELLQAIVKRCTGDPMNVEALDKLAIKEIDDIADGKLHNVLGDSKRRKDSNESLARGFAPIHIDTLFDTKRIIGWDIRVPDAIAVDFIQGFTHVIQPWVIKHNAQRRPQFNLAKAKSTFHIHCQTVKHVLGAKGTEHKNSHIATMIASANDLKNDDQKKLQRRDLHVALLENNCQCTAALYVLPALNSKQRAYLETTISKCAGNFFDWDYDCDY